MKLLNTLCIAALAGALVRMLIPDDKFAKQITALIAAVFLLAGINALRGAEYEIDSDYALKSGQVNGTLTENVNEKLREKVCKEFSDKIYEILNSKGIFPKEIRVAVNISGLYSINITQAELVFDKGEQAAAEVAAEVLQSVLPSSIAVKTEVK